MEESDGIQTARGWRVWVARIGAAGLLLVGLGIAANSAFAATYAGRIYPGVAVAGLNVGGMTHREAAAALAAGADRYHLTLKVGDKTFNVGAEKLGAVYDVETTVDAAMAVGHGHYLALLGLFDNKQAAPIPYAFQVDRAILKEYVEKVVTGVGQAPVDAAVVVTNGTPAVQPDKPGRSIVPSRLMKLVEESLAGGQPTDLEIKPTIHAADIVAAAVAPTVEVTKKIIATPVTLIYNDKSFSPTAAQIGSWVGFQKQAMGNGYILEPVIDTSQLKNYLQNVANQVDVAPTNKHVTVKNGVSSVDNEGADGLAVDQEAAAAAISAEVIKQTPVTYAITTKPVAFKTITNQIVTLDLGRYIEINLSLQHLWVYQDHNLIYESPVTSGATGAGLGTATGLFSIYYKTTNTHLVGYQYGYNYDVAVQYWMPFYKGYGLHDASWRHGVFGGPDYYYNGSHGCVNLPDATAAWLYGWADVGTPVWVHN